MDKKENRPLPDPKDIYPDPVERSKRIFKQQEKTNRARLLTSIVIFIIVILALVGIFLLYRAKIFKINKEGVANQVSDEIVKSDLARARTVSVYYYRSYLSFEGMDADSDFKKIAEDVSNHGSDLKIHGLGEKTFVAYVVLPESKEYYCTDAKGFLGKTPPITPSQTSCQ